MSQPLSSDLSAQRIEFTSDYQDEFDRLLAIVGKAEKTFKDARDEYERAEAALLKHIESRHYGAAKP